MEGNLKMQLYYLVFGLFFMFSSNASAVELETIKVTSSRDMLTADNIPGSLSVFTEKEIKKKQHQKQKLVLKDKMEAILSQAK